MQKTILVVALALFVAFVAADLPQSVYVTPLTNGVAVNGRIPDNLPDELIYYTNVYSFYVPANTTYLNVSVIVTSPSDDCDAVQGLYRANGAPCAEDNYPYENWLCGNTDYFTIYQNEESDPVYFYITPGYGSHLGEFITGATVWFGVAPYYDDSENCTYTVQVQSYDICPTGTVGITANLNEDSAILGCSPFTTVPYNGTSTYNVIATGALDDDETKAFLLFNINVPLDTASISINMNVSYDFVEIYGTQYSPLGTSDNTVCDDDTDGTECGNGYYCYSLICYTPRMGSYWINAYALQNWNGTISFSTMQCSPPAAGPNCNFTQTAMYLNQTAPLTISIPYRSTVADVYWEVLYYIDVPANYSGPDFYMTMSSSADNAFFLPRVNGYPSSDEVFGYDVEDFFDIASAASGGSVWALGSFDYVFAGRYYLAFGCDDSAGCTVVVNFNTSAPLTSGTSTSATTTASSSGVSSTTASSGGSSTTARVSTTYHVATTSIVSTTAAPAATTAHSSGFEVIVPSIVLLLVALLLF